MPLDDQIKSILAQEMAQAHVELTHAVDSPVFAWQGQDYICTYTLKEGQWLDEGGFVPQDMLTIQVLSAILPDPGPQRLQRVTVQFKGMLAPKDFWIQAINRSPGNYLTFQCWDTNKGA